MSTIKAKAIEWIQALPDDCTLEDIRYQLYLRHQVEQGMQALADGEVVSHEEVKRRMSEWLASFGQPQR
jgi:predicted transcriptional regulator